MNPIGEHVEQVKVNAERIIRLAAKMRMKHGLPLIAYPGEKANRRAERQRQKLCEIMIDHSGIFVHIRWIEENGSPIQSPLLLSQCPEFQEVCERQSGFIWKGPSEVNHRAKPALLHELEQGAGASDFTGILDLNQQHLTDLKETTQEFNGFIQRIDMTTDAITWSSQGHPDVGPDCIIQDPRFVAADFLHLFIQHADSSLRPCYPLEPLGVFTTRLLFLKDPPETNASLCGSFAALVDWVAHTALEYNAVGRTSGNSEIAMNATLESRRIATESKLHEILSSLDPICGFLDIPFGPIFRTEIIFFLEPDRFMSSYFCSKCRSLAFWQVQNGASQHQLETC
jgi:hypothetical protein